MRFLVADGKTTDTINTYLVTNLQLWQHKDYSVSYYFFLSGWSCEMLKCVVWIIKKTLHKARLDNTTAHTCVHMELQLKLSIVEEKAFVSESTLLKSKEHL